MSETSKKPPMYDRDLVFFDLETTGLDPDVHEIIQIGAIVLHANKDVTAFKCYVEPLHPELAEPKALEVNGYTPERWREASAVSLPEALRFFKNACMRNECILAAWNPTFDKPFLRRGYILWEGQLPKAVDYHFLDVASMAWSLVLERKIETIKLEKVCEYLGISNEGAHDAGRDCERMVAVYKRLMKLLPEMRRSALGVKP